MVNRRSRITEIDRTQRTRDEIVTIHSLSATALSKLPSFGSFAVKLRYGRCVSISFPSPNSAANLVDENTDRLEEDDDEADMSLSSFVGRRYCVRSES